MTANILVTSPYQPFTLPDKFSAVFNGYIYCGLVDKDPTVPANQVQIYLVNEDGSQVPVPQPLRTNAGGFLVYNGKPAKFVTASNHSLLVQDSRKGQIWYEPDMAVFDPQSFISALALPDGVNLVGGAVSKSDLQVEKNRISVLEFAKFEQYQRADWISNILRDGVNSGTSREIDFLLFGDSTMWGAIPFNTTAQDPKNPAVALKQSIDLIFPGNKVTVINGARSGTTLKQLLNGTDGGSGTYAERLSRSQNGMIVFCNHCLNDCGSYESNLYEYHNNLVSFVNITRSYGKIPVLVTPSMISPIADGREDQNKRQSAFINEMRNVAGTMSVDIVDNFSYSKASSRLYSPESIAPDGIHLSQLFYQQAGWNMSIPIVIPNHIKLSGDLCGLSSSQCADNVSNSRAIQLRAQSRFSAVLFGDASQQNQYINYPVVIDDATKDTFIALGCSTTAVGGRAQMTYFGFEGQLQFNGIADFKAGSVSDFDSLASPSVCKLPAGLSIVGLKISTSISPAPNVNFSFSGVQVFNRNESGFGFPSFSGFQLSRPILVKDEVLTQQYMTRGTTLIELKQAASPFNTMATLKWDQDSNKVVLTTPSGVIDVWASPQPTSAACMLIINDDRTITAKVGALSATSSPLSFAPGVMFVSSPGSYSVRKP